MQQTRREALLFRASFVVSVLTSSAFAAAARQMPPEPGSCPNTVCRIIAHGHYPELHFPDFVDFRDQLVRFYAPSYEPVWIAGDKPNPQALAVIALLKVADLKGLKPADYDADLWDYRIVHFDRSEFEFSLTLSVMRYLADLHFGKANPGFFHLDPRYSDFDIANFIHTKLLTEADLPPLIEAEVEPPYAGYKRTEKALADYLVKARGADIKLSEITATVEPESHYAEANLLLLRLQQLGDMPADHAPTEPSQSYRGALVAGVKRFQLRHGIEPDGRIGKVTIEQLNIPLSHRVLQLQLSLERWRWVPHTFTHPPIVVNIPEFTLRTLDAKYETDLKMKVVVGSSYENQTPVFSANLGYITFRPYWNVPNSILQNEMLQKLRDNRNYLAEHRYQLINAAERAVPAPDGLTDSMLRSLASGRYRLRQMPGPACALGLLRFGIPNEHNVYLHDTPSQTLFAVARRDFSHGCVRVEHPVDLAVWSLRGTDTWTVAKIRRAMHGGRTFQVNLKNPIPVLLVYATAIVDSNNEVHFTPDIYRQDALLENRMAEGYPSRNITP